MKQAYLLGLTCWMLLVGGASAQTNHTLSGYITDAATGETLIGATVWSESAGQGVASNVYGFYTLTLPAARTTSASITSATPRSGLRST